MITYGDRKSLKYSTSGNRAAHPIPSLHVSLWSQVNAMHVKHAGHCSRVSFSARRNASEAQAQARRLRLCRACVWACA